MIHYSYLNMNNNFMKEGGGKKRVNTYLAHLLSLQDLETELQNTKI